MSLGQPELEFAIKNFKSNYDKFAKCHAGRLVRMEGEAIESAIDAAAREENLGASALLLESEIGNILSQIKRTRQIRDAGWTGKLAKFIGKLYPLATTCFRLTNAAAEVVSSCGNFRLTTQAASIIPLKGVTDGVAIILQVYLYCFALVLNQKILETSQRMTEDFYLQLKRIEYQASRVAGNPGFKRIADAETNPLKQKGIHLMNAIVIFLNSALLYFSEGQISTQSGFL